MMGKAINNGEERKWLYGKRKIVEKIENGKQRIKIRKEKNNPIYYSDNSDVNSDNSDR